MNTRNEYLRHVHTEKRCLFLSLRDVPDVADSTALICLAHLSSLRAKSHPSLYMKFTRSLLVALKCPGPPTSDTCDNSDTFAKKAQIHAVQSATYPLRDKAPSLEIDRTLPCFRRHCRGSFLRSRLLRSKPKVTLPCFLRVATKRSAVMNSLCFAIISLSLSQAAHERCW